MCYQYHHLYCLINNICLIKNICISEIITLFSYFTIATFLLLTPIPLLTPELVQFRQGDLLHPGLGDPHVEGAVLPIVGGLHLTGSLWWCTYHPSLLDILGIISLPKILHPMAHNYTVWPAGPRNSPILVHTVLGHRDKIFCLEQQQKYQQTQDSASLDIQPASVKHMLLNCGAKNMKAN